MSYLTESELRAVGFRSLGKDVRISTRASIYSPELMSIGDHVRIDDFCVLSGELTLGRNSSIAVFCNLAAGRSSITLGEFATLAYGCQIVAQSDDYSGESMSSPTVPREFKREVSMPVVIGNYSILGTNTVVLPGVTIPEGVASGAGTLFLSSPDEWSIYVGAPARRIRARSRRMLNLRDRYLEQYG